VMKLIVPFRNSSKTPSYTKYWVSSTLNQVSPVLSYVRREPGSILRRETRDPNRDFDVLSLAPSNECQYSAFQICQQHSHPYDFRFNFTVFLSFDSN